MDKHFFAQHIASMTPARDYPYYAGHPVPVTGHGWLIILGGVALGFAALVTIPVSSFPATMGPPLLFVGIPLLALALVTGRHWTALFRPVGLKQLGQMVLMGLATMAVSVVLALAISSLAATAPNPRILGIASSSLTDLMLALLPTLPQLVGEELLAILPFLAILWFGTAKLGWSRGLSIAVALIGSSLLFGAAHLPTYDWNLGQSLGLIGGVRVVLTLAYMWTKNLWVSAGAHIFNDWTEILVVRFLDAAGA